jgi:RNA polymerase sigma-70 factor (ECF subfamily)
VKPYTTRDDFAALTLYDLHAAALYSYIYRRVGQRQDAEDLLLEVFTAALKHDNLVSLAQQQQFAWLQSVARRRIIDRYRHNARVVLLPLEQALETYDDALTPEEQALRREAHERPCSINPKVLCARWWCVFCASCALFTAASKEGLCDAAIR